MGIWLSGGSLASPQQSQGGQAADYQCSPSLVSGGLDGGGGDRGGGAPDPCGSDRESAPIAHPVETGHKQTWNAHHIS